MDTPTIKQPPQDGDAACLQPSGSAASLFLGDMAVIQRLLSERGFQIARGTYHHGNGDTLSTVVITRRDTPEWSGEWAPWDPEPDGEGEVQCALFLCGLACAKWDRDAWMFLPNTQFRDAGGQSPALRTDDQPNSL